MYLGTCLSLGGMKQKQRKGSEVLLYNPPPDYFFTVRHLHNHICKEQSKDSFYSEFVLQSIINMFGPFGVWQGGGMAYLNEADKTQYLYVR